MGIACSSDANSPEIVIQNLQMDLPEGIPVFSEDLLIGEIAETDIQHIAYVGPSSQTIRISDGYVTMLIFLQGEGTLTACGTLS